MKSVRWLAMGRTAGGVNPTDQAQGSEEKKKGRELTHHRRMKDTAAMADRLAFRGSSHRALGGENLRVSKTAELVALCVSQPPPPPPPPRARSHVTSRAGHRRSLVVHVIRADTTTDPCACSKFREEGGVYFFATRTERCIYADGGGRRVRDRVF